jgi:D-amino-acid oxidase
LRGSARMGITCKSNVLRNTLSTEVHKDKTIILNPNVFLLWLKTRLEKSGVVFNRMSLNSLSDAAAIPHDVIINATGVGAAKLADVQDQDVRKIWGQTIVVKSEYDKLFMHDNGRTYTYAIPRLDGTVILGGIRRSGAM